jgi:hypothetical protein
MSLPVRPGRALEAPSHDIACGLNVECSFPATPYERYVVEFINSFVNNINQTTRFYTPPTDKNILDLKEKLFILLKDPPPEEDMDGGAKKRNKSKRRNHKKSNKKSRRHRNRKRLSRRNAKRFY